MKNIIKITALAIALLMVLMLPVAAIGVGKSEKALAVEEISADGASLEETSDENTSMEEPVDDMPYDMLDILYGDVNGDGLVDNLDAAMVLKYDADMIRGFDNQVPKQALTPEVEEMIGRAYYDYYDGLYGITESYEDAHIEVYYYGNYSGCEVAYITDYVFEESMGYELYIVAGYTFHYTTGRRLSVYKDGAFYTVSDAYEKGYLTARDVFNIALQRGTIPETAIGEDGYLLDEFDNFIGQKEISVRSIYGDANGDKAVDSLDAAWILKYDAGIIDYR